MDKEKLQQILELKNAQAIDREIVHAGFFDMAKHPTLKKISLVPIIQSENLVMLDSVETDKFIFTMAKNDNVEKYPKHEFIWIQVDKFNKRKGIWFPHILKMYAKEKK